MTEEGHQDWVGVNSFQFVIGRGIGSPVGRSSNREVNVDTGNDTLTVALGNISMKASAGEITLEATKKITLKVGGSTITITPSGIVLETGGSKIDMADAQAKVGGAMVQIACSGMTEVTGGIVKIN